jgi:hypothetical protein
MSDPCDKSKTSTENYSFCDEKDCDKSCGSFGEGSFCKNDSDDSKDSDKSED